MIPRYRFTVFLAAFLLFFVQPIAGKLLLPQFGGGSGVWTTCLLFFQGLLLAGYGYAHWIGRYSRRTQAIVHASLLGSASLLLPFLLFPNKQGASQTDPVLAIVLSLGRLVGLPYFLLASTGPLLQSWYRDETGGQSPYRLYALSNAASFLALLGYPFLIEPWITLRLQTWIWSFMFVVCAGTTIAAVGLFRTTFSAPREITTQRPSARAVIFWIALSACSSAILMSATNLMCQEVVSIPFLWLMPLALYLLTFTLCFDHERWYRRRWLGVSAAGITILASGLAYRLDAIATWEEIAVFTLTIGICCMVCHGELAAAKPEPTFLTQFYLAIAAGGAVGGLLVAVFAPRLFKEYSEFPIALAFCCLLALVGWRKGNEFTGKRPWIPWLIAGCLAAASVSALSGVASPNRPGQLFSIRNFYGILRVRELRKHESSVRSLSHGKTIHGTQFLDPDMRRWPTTYYGPHSAIGLALTNHPRRSSPDRPARALKIGVVGLGTGTIAAFGQPGDLMRFYDINPAVEGIAREYFTYLADSHARIEVVTGDARVQMAREAPQAYDVLTIDAFSSDAIPAHLLTQEAADIYRRHLKSDGLLLLHISNRSLDLAPVTRSVAARLGWRIEPFDKLDATDARRGVVRAIWTVISANEGFWNDPEIIRRESNWYEDTRTVVWTDDFTSLTHILRLW